MWQKSLFQFSVDNALEMVIMFAEDGRVLYTNKSAQKKLEYKDACTDIYVKDIFPGEFQDEDIQRKMQELAGEEAGNMMAYRGNRTCFSAKVRFLVCEDFKEYMQGLGESRVYMCMAQDISTENLLEKQSDKAKDAIQAAEKMKTEFVANVTHELRTPVNGVLGNTQELISGEIDREKLKLLGLIERSCKDMNSIINNILDFSKLDAGKFVLEPRQFEFRNMIEYIKGNHKNRIVEKGLQFSVSVSPDVPECIIGDELRIVQILNNLISNAYKFTAVGEIHLEVIKTAQAGKRIELFFLVMDTGIGIAKADQDKLFKSFSQVDASISRKYGGTGLGLNICKQLVELMDGSIHVQSEEGKGTMFSFHIWVDLPEEACVESEEYVISQSETELLEKLQSLSGSAMSANIRKYGSKENFQEIEKKMSKLILCIEMESWDKAEMLAESVKQLTEDAPREVKSAALRLKMAVQKGDYDKAIASFELLKNNM